MPIWAKWLISMATSLLFMMVSDIKILIMNSLSTLTSSDRSRYSIA